MAQLARTGHFHAQIFQPLHATPINPAVRTCFALTTSHLTRTRMPVLLAGTPKPQQCFTSRSASTTNGKASSPDTILAQQRLRRPLSPHLTIYRPQITSTLSVLMRLSGLAMSAAFCFYPLLYLASPYLGIDVSAEALAAYFGSLSAMVKVPVKVAAAWTFTFHSFNSLRFLSWDLARGITNKRLAQTGWMVVVASFASALVLAPLV